MSQVETGTWHGVKLGVPQRIKKKTPSDGEKPSTNFNIWVFPEMEQLPNKF
jgi:hypothetical protein